MPIAIACDPNDHLRRSGFQPLEENAEEPKIPLAKRSEVGRKHVTRDHEHITLRHPDIQIAVKVRCGDNSHFSPAITSKSAAGISRRVAPWLSNVAQIFTWRH